MTSKKERKKEKIREKQIIPILNAKLHYQEYQIPPYNQEHLRALFLEYCSHGIFKFPMHHQNIMKKIRTFYQNIQNSQIYMNQLDLGRVISELIKINIIKARPYALGTKVVMLVERIDKASFIELAKLHKNQRPTSHPPDPITFKQQRAICTEQEKQYQLKMKEAMSGESIFGNQRSLADLYNQHTSFQQIGKMEEFKSKGNEDLCNYCTRDKCMVVNGLNCKKRHFRAIITANTDQSMGNCPHLNACHNPDCKHIHYAPEQEKNTSKKTINQMASKTIQQCEWINCDMRTFDFTVLGKFDVIMADPPWDIHMTLPYGTMKDKQMVNLRVDLLQDHGVIFLWVTGRAMQLGRQCLERWGYHQIDELVWIKTNQIQRLIITGKTGHWLNHSKQHCLVGIKGNPDIRTKLDCDIIVSQVRQTSRKPDEIYGIIQRLHPRGKKIELFGRPQNSMPGWLTLGNQLPGVYLLDKQIIARYKKSYPEHQLTEEKMRQNLEKLNAPQNYNQVYHNHLQKNG